MKNCWKKDRSNCCTNRRNCWGIYLDKKFRNWVPDFGCKHHFPAAVLVQLQTLRRGLTLVYAWFMFWCCSICSGWKSKRKRSCWAWNTHNEFIHSKKSNQKCIDQKKNTFSINFVGGTELRLYLCSKWIPLNVSGVNAPKLMPWRLFFLWSEFCWQALSLNTLKVFVLDVNTFECSQSLSHCT